MFLLESADAIRSFLNKTFPNDVFEINVSTCKINISVNNKMFVFWINDWFNKKEIILKRLTPTN